MSYGVCMCTMGPPAGGVCRACGMAGVGYNPNPLPFVYPARAPVLCPVCMGKQRVKSDFYPTGITSADGEYVTCRTCGGRGVV